MPQVTIYLDANTEEQARSAAQAKGIPFSKWISGVIREKTASSWPQEVLDLAGAWPDFPSLEDLRKHQGEDAPRESL